MRRIVALVTGVLTLVAVTAVAIGDEAGPSPQGQVQALEVTHSPNKASTKKKKVGTNAKVVIDLKCQPTCPGQFPDKPSPTVRTIVTLPKGLILNYTKFPQCTQAKLEANGPRGCPSKSKVGTGNIKANAKPVVNDPVGGTVTAFNGKNKTYLLYVVPEISSPLVIPGKLSGNKLDFKVPLVPTLPGQPNATLTHFEVTTGKAKVKKGKGKRRKTYSYIENPTKCSGGYKWTLAFTYENGETLSPSDTATCKK
jgi:hypothetical protein